MGAQENGVFAVVHGDFGNGDVFAFFQCLGQQRVGAASGFFRHHVVRGFKVDGVDVGSFHEFENLHGLGGLRLDLLDLVGLDDDVFVFAELVALDHVVAIDNLAIGLANVLLLEPRFVRAVQHVERNARTAGAREKAHRHGDESER